LKQLNPDYVKAILDYVNQGPYFRLLSMAVREMGIGYATVEMDIANKHLNPSGGVHGGVYSSLIDTATFWAVFCDVDENSGLVSLDVKVDNLASAREGHLEVKGKRIKAGKNICISEAVIVDSQGKYLAHGTSKQMVIPGLPTMSQRMTSLGSKPLPPKFISKAK
jgi:uncharacterized protein (TIGR00369 family)